MSRPTNEWKIGELCQWVNNEYDTVKLYELVQHRIVMLLDEGMDRDRIRREVRRPLLKVVAISAERIGRYTFSAKVRSAAVNELTQDVFDNYDAGYYRQGSLYAQGEQS